MLTIKRAVLHAAKARHAVELGHTALPNHRATTAAERVTGCEGARDRIEDYLETRYSHPGAQK